jgi:UPF0716 protein FxsA
MLYKKSFRVLPWIPWLFDGKSGIQTNPVHCRLHQSSRILACDYTLVFHPGFGYVAPMNPFPVLLLLFLLVPLIEIYVMIKVGGIIGALPTVLLVVLTAVVGAALARLQGLATLQRLQATLARGETPAIEMFEGVLLLVGALLLLTPGFITDLLGFACLIPFTRRALAFRVLKRVTVVTPAGTTRNPPGEHQPRTIEGDYRREDD